MFKALRDLLAPAPSNPPKPKETTAKVTPKSPPADTPYRSAAVIPGIKCCAAAKSAKDQRHLMRDAPTLPLTNCTMPSECSCKFKKASDRRDGDRRDIGISETGRWYAGSENRKGSSRRSAK